MYKLRQATVIAACKRVIMGWEDRDARLKALFTGDDNGKND